MAPPLPPPIPAAALPYDSLVDVYPHLPPTHFLVPLLWLTITITLLHDARGTGSSPYPKPVSVFLALLTFSVTLVATFHSVFVSTPFATNQDPLFTSPIISITKQQQQQPQLPDTHAYPPNLALQKLPVSVRRLHIPHPIRQLPNQSPAPTPPATDDFPVVVAQSPTPAPSPAPPPATSPAPVTAAPATQPVDEGPTLQECGGALSRMQAFLLLEFIIEIFLFILRCLAQDDEDEPTLDMSYRTFTLVRGIYAVIVLILNASIVWIGGGRVGECLPKHPELQITYAHLLLYAIACIFFVILRMYRLTQYDSEKYTTTNYTSETPSYLYDGRERDSRYPPTRTSSSYDTRRHGGRSRRRTRTSNYSSSSSTDEPRCHMDCGCCAINLP